MATTATPAFQRDFLPRARPFFEGELGKFTRPNRKGWALADCPFHKSRGHRSLSVNIESGSFHCFGCDAKGGDVLAFVMLRDKCDFKAAAKTLGCWRDVSEVERREFDRQAARRREQREEEQRRKERAHAELVELRNELHLDIEIQAEASARLSELLAGGVPDYEDEAEHLWSILSMLTDDLRDCEQRYMAMAGLEECAA